MAASTLFRSFCWATASLGSLKDVHNSSCHPDIARVHHFVRCKNLPCSVDDVKPVPYENWCCKSLARNSTEVTASNYWWLMAIVHGYHPRFSFIYYNSNLLATRVVRVLTSIPSIFFRVSSYVHSDRVLLLCLKNWRTFPTVTAFYLAFFNCKAKWTGSKEPLSGLSFWRLSQKCTSQPMGDCPSCVLHSLLCTNKLDLLRTTGFLWSQIRIRSICTSEVEQYRSKVYGFVKSTMYDPLVKEVQLFEDNLRYPIYGSLVDKNIRFWQNIWYLVLQPQSHRWPNIPKEVKHQYSLKNTNSNPALFVTILGNKISVPPFYPCIDNRYSYKRTWHASFGKGTIRHLKR